MRDNVRSQCQSWWKRTYRLLYSQLFLSIFLWCNTCCSFREARRFCGSRKMAVQSIRQWDRLAPSNIRARSTVCEVLVSSTRRESQRRFHQRRWNKKHNWQLLNVQMCAMKRCFAKSKFTSKRKHSREKIELFVVFSSAMDVQTLWEDAIRYISPAFSCSEAEFSKLTFANVPLKGLDQKTNWQVLFFVNNLSYVAGPCYERLQNFHLVNWCVTLQLITWTLVLEIDFKRYIEWIGFRTINRNSQLAICYNCHGAAAKNILVKMTSIREIRPLE